MHEASIIEYTLNAVESAARARGIRRVSEITLVIGKQRIALPEALQHIFSLLTDDTIFEGATLVIKEKDVIIHCDQCGMDSRLPGLSTGQCPHCGGENVHIIQGNELMIYTFKGV